MGMVRMRLIPSHEHDVHHGIWRTFGYVSWLCMQKLRSGKHDDYNFLGREGGALFCIRVIEPDERQPCISNLSISRW